MIGLLPFFAGLVLWLGTSLHTLGIALLIIGTVIIIAQAVAMVAAFKFVKKL